jgi:long-chain acyl-CoA synthetase
MIGLGLPGLGMLRKADLAVRRDVTLGTVMGRLAAVHADQRLVEDADGELRCTFRQATKRVNRWAGGVAARTEPGDRVVVATGNGYEQFLLCLAVSRAGCIPAPVNPQMSQDEIDHVVGDCGARFMLRSPNQVDDGVPLLVDPNQQPGDLAALFYTSGTTGRPKGVELTHRALVGQVIGGVLYPSGLRRDEAVVALPVAHIMGFVTLLSLAAAGIPAFHLRRFDADAVLTAIERRRATVFVGVPAMYRMMLEAGAESHDLSSVRLWASGADVMPPELAARFKRMGATASLPVVGGVGEAMFAEGYGMVEVGGGVAAKISPPMCNVGLGESVGFPLPSYHMRVVDDSGSEVAHGQVGELWVRGPGMLKGYWNAPEATRAVMTDDGWLRTGDLARRGPLGSVAFVGREKDVIIRGGYTIYALEVQEALEQHPQVVEAAVTAMGDDRLGEVPVAAIRLAADANPADGPNADGPTLTGDDVRAWARDHLASYKVPVQIRVVEDLPRTGTRKVQRQALLELFS